jgi:1,4-alpha-glucan branching enzyme
MSHSIEFKLCAPYNSKASLTGDFLGDESVEMQKGDDGWFRTQVELEDGSYRYQFQVRSRSFFLDPDEWVGVIDPYATEVDEAAHSAIVHVKEGVRSLGNYTWQHDEADLPENDALVIYEMLVQDFTDRNTAGGGTFQAVTDKLDYLQDLGINALELMPVQDCPGDQGWGYNIRHYFALRPEYGQPDDLKRLIDECHARQMRVILDVVPNHSEAESPLTKINFDYWYHREAKDPDNSWGPEFDYDHYDDNYERHPARDFMRDVVNFWIAEYHFDGLRFDAVKQLGNPEFLGDMVDQAGLTAQPKPLFTIAEQIPEDPALSSLEGPVDGSWRVSFHYNLLDVLLKGAGIDRVKELLDPTPAGFQSATNVVNYATSHDQNRLMVHLAEADIFDEAAFKRAKFAAVLVMTAMGVPMIWMGEEIGEPQAKTLEPAPLDWSLLENDANAGLLQYYRGLIALRKENAALRSDNIAIFHENADAQVLGYIRWHEMGARVAVLVNCSDNYLANYEINDLPEDGSWHEWTKSYDVQVEGGKLTLDLPEYEAQVLVWSA